MSKHSELLKLAHKRKEAEHQAEMGWQHYGHLRQYHSDCDYVSPYSKGANNTDSAIFVLLQDWSSDEFLRKNPIDDEVEKYGRTRNLPTNRNLENLLFKNFGLKLSDVYATNLFPFIKRGGLSAPIAKSDLLRAAQEFALPQIEIVQPRLVVCLGLSTANAIFQALMQQPKKTLADAIESPFSHTGIRIWCQAHTGAFGQMNRRRKNTDQVALDWARMRADVGWTQEMQPTSNLAQ